MRVAMPLTAVSIAVLVGAAVIQMHGRRLYAQSMPTVTSFTITPSTACGDNLPTAEWTVKLSGPATQLYYVNPGTSNFRVAYPEGNTIPAGTTSVSAYIRCNYVTAPVSVTIPYTVSTQPGGGGVLIGSGSATFTVSSASPPCN